MNSASLHQSKIENLNSKITNYGRLVRFSHTIFALPFALASVALAWPRHPVTLRILVWILVAMVGALFMGSTFALVTGLAYFLREVHLATRVRIRIPAAK